MAAASVLSAIAFDLLFPKDDAMCRRRITTYVIISSIFWARVVIAKLMNDKSAYDVLWTIIILISPPVIFFLHLEGVM